MDNMDLLKLIVFEACEDGRVDDFDKQDMLNFIEEAVKLQDKKEHDKILSANRRENLRDNDIHQEYAIIAKIKSGEILFRIDPYRYGVIDNKNISKKSALQNVVNNTRRDVGGGLVSFGYGKETEAIDMLDKLRKEYRTDGRDNYEWAQKVAKLKNKCSIMSPEFRKACGDIISKYK